MTINNGKVALVTGASSGIGRATAEVLSKAGYRVFGTARQPEQDSVTGIRMLACDVTDDASVAAMVQQLQQEAGRIDLLVNNAGQGLFGAAEETSLAETRALFEVNLFGLIRVTHAVLPIMRRQSAGRIVNLSSVQGFVPVPFYAVYSATKHAVEGYSQALDHELRTLGIRVVLVEPGFTRTRFEANLLRPAHPIAAYDVLRTGVEAAVKGEMQKGDPVKVVADCILRAATDKAPSLRYAAGKSARTVSLLRRYAPASGFDKSIRKMFGLPD